MPKVVVQKYGGSSLSTLDKIGQVADRIVETCALGHRVVAVVSAMSGKTDELLAFAKELSANPNARELDMLMSVGERISTALLSIALEERGMQAVSFTGSQAGIITNARHNRARIVEVRPYRVLDQLDAGKVVVVAGYQGVSYGREITTLGRGGTDTTAVALAAALEAEHCEICSDVDGVYTADPRVVPTAQRRESLDYETMVALARHGAKVLNQDCIEMASRWGVALFAKATFGPRDDSGTVVRMNPALEPPAVTAITHRKQVLRIDLAPDADASRLIGLMAGVGAFATTLEGGGSRQLTATIALDDTHRASLLSSRLDETFGQQVQIDNRHGTVTVVGHGLGEEPDVLRGILAVSTELLGSTPELSMGPLAATLSVPSDKVTAMVKGLHGALLEAPTVRDSSENV